MTPDARRPATAIPTDPHGDPGGKSACTLPSTLSTIWLRGGELGHYRVGRSIRILPADIDAYQRDTRPRERGPGRFASPSTPRGADDATIRVWLRPTL